MTNKHCNLHQVAILGPPDIILARVCEGIRDVGALWWDFGGGFGGCDMHLWWHPTSATSSGPNVALKGGGGAMWGWIHLLVVSERLNTTQQLMKPPSWARGTPRPALMATSPSRVRRANPTITDPQSLPYGHSPPP